MAMVDLTPAAEGSQSAPHAALLSVADLHVSFQTPHGVVEAVRGVSLTIGRGETMGVLGESGSGKSVSVGAVMGLLDSPPAQITGELRYAGIDLLRSPVRETRRIHGDRIAMINQDAVTSLNPGLSVGYQIAEMFRIHRPGISRGDARRKAVELMDRVKIPSARQRVQSYPHELSGGMSQRVMIAMAIALEPDILIADEPTTALDVTVQAQIMQLLAELREQTGMALILITHDLGVVAESVEHVLVMYAGRIIERGPTAEVIARPAHPYTVGLMNSVPRAERKDRKLATIEGAPPVLTAIPPGCAFHPRCGRSKPICASARPELHRVATGRASACHFAAEVLGG